MNPNFLNRTAMVESGNNPNARNPRSSASGVYQFTDGTYLPIARGLFPGQSDQSLLSMKNQADVQKQAMGVLTKQNTDALTAAGYEANDRNLYLSHFAGSGGATKLLGADPKAPVSSILGAKVIEANPFLANMTVNDMLNWSASKMTGGDPNSANVTSPPQETYTPYTDSMLEGGPLALFGKGQQGYDWGNALTGAGAALASINSPQQAAALTALRSQGRGNDISVEVDKNTGLVYTTNKRTGQTQVRQDQAITQSILDVARGRKKMEEELKDYKPSKTTEDQFRDNNTNIGNLSQNLSELELYQKALANGQIDMSLLGRARRGALTAADQNDPNLNMVTGFNAWLVKMQNDSLRLNKGVQTEGDAQRAMNEFLTPTAQFNNASAATSMARLGRGFADYAQRLIDEQETVLKRSDKAARYFDPDETVRNNYGTYRQGLKAQRDYYEQEFQRLTAPRPPEQPQNTPNKPQTGIGYRLRTN